MLLALWKQEAGNSWRLTAQTDGAQAVVQERDPDSQKRKALLLSQGRNADDSFSPRFMQLANFTGIPGIVVPIGYSMAGLPIGFQVSICSVWMLGHRIPSWLCHEPL